MYVYILRCLDGSYYTGVTNNLEKRLDEHDAGIDESCYTFRRRPLKLVYYELYYSPVSAIEREKQIKGWRREKKEALINEQKELLPKLSRNYKDRSP